MRRAFLALAAYLLLSAAFHYPLLSFRFSAEFIGTPGDSVFGIWNLWHFRQTLGNWQNLFWTDLQYWPYGANLLLHHYTPVNGLIAAGLPGLGLPAVYNLLQLLSVALAGWGVFLMLRDWGHPWGAAFTCGAAYALSPIVLYAGERGCAPDLTQLHALPFFVWALARAARGRRMLDSFWAALCLTWAWCYNYYHFLFCALLTGFFYLWLERPLTPSLAPKPSSDGLRVARRTLEAALAAVALWVAGSMLRGQHEFHGRGSPRELLLYTAPYLLFWALAAARLWAGWSPRLVLRKEALRPHALAPYAGVMGFWLLLNLPLVVASAHFILSGDYGGTSRPWRGGGNPVDPVYYLLPNIYHRFWGEPSRRLVERLGYAQLDSAPLGWVLLAASTWHLLRGTKERWASAWYAGAAFSLLLALGPWLKVFQTHTYLPLPFYFLHLLPVFSNLQTSHRFNIYIVLFLSLALASCLRELKARAHARLSPWIVPAALALLVLEYAPRDRATFRLETPALLQRLRARAPGAVLTLPTGAIFNGLSAQGAWGTAPDLAWQLAHGQPHVGGYLTRVSRRTYLNMLGDPFLAALIAAQAGAPPELLLRDRGLVLRSLEQNRVRYVLLDSARIPPALQQLVAGWPLRLVDQGDGLRLYERYGL